MQIHIRVATSADLPAIERLYAHADVYHQRALARFFSPIEGPARPAAYLQECLDRDDATILLAEDVYGDKDGDAVGLVHLYERATPPVPMLVPRRYLVIEGIVVLPEAQRAGVGSALLQHAEAWALSRGLDEVELTVWEFNVGARQFYEAQGYATVRRSMWKPLDGAEEGP